MVFYIFKFPFNHFACFKLKSCWDLICFIGIVNTIVFRPVFAHNVLTTEESLPPEIPTIRAFGFNEPTHSSH